MSQIKLKHSGGNSVIIAAPSSNPASDRTLTLPGDADGTILTSNSSVGKILQVVTNEITSVVSITGQSHGNWLDVTGINVTITPTVASSKVIVQINLGKVAHNSNSTAVKFTRSVAGGSASVIKTGTADGNRIAAMTNIIGTGQINNNHSESFNFQFTDTPSYSVGQAIVYQMQVMPEGTGLFVVNRSYDDSNETYNFRARCFSNLTAMEVAA